VATLCAQYNVEITFDDYIDGSPIDHAVLENELRTAMQTRLDELMSTGARRNPLVPTMYVTNVAFETDYPHPDSIPDDVGEWTAQHWITHLKKVEDLSLSELTDRQYVQERIEINTNNLGRPFEPEAVASLAAQVVAITRGSC
jgi:hypothetical protein